jgi:hypothetical protein
MVLPDRIELSTSPLPRECSTTELRQHGGGTCPPEARGNCHKGWQGARKVPGDLRAARVGRIPFPLAAQTGDVVDRCSGTSWTLSGPRSTAGRGGATSSGRPRTSALLRDGSRPGSVPKHLLRVNEINDFYFAWGCSSENEGSCAKKFGGARGRWSRGCHPGLPRRATYRRTPAMTHRRSEDDQERLAAALRANLARRKAQARQRQEGEPRQRQEGEPPAEARLRPTEGAPEPGGPRAAGNQESHDSAGFVGDKPSE